MSLPAAAAAASAAFALAASAAEAAADADAAAAAAKAEAEAQAAAQAEARSASVIELESKCGRCSAAAADPLQAACRAELQRRTQLLRTEAGVPPHSQSYLIRSARGGRDVIHADWPWRWSPQPQPQLARRHQSDSAKPQPQTEAAVAVAKPQAAVAQSLSLASPTSVASPVATSAVSSSAAAALSLSLAFQFLSTGELLRVDKVNRLWHSAACSPLTFRGSVKVELDPSLNLGVPARMATKSRRDRMGDDREFVGIRVRGPSCTFERPAVMRAAAASSLFRNFRIVTVVAEASCISELIDSLAEFPALHSVSIKASSLDAKDPVPFKVAVKLFGGSKPPPASSRFPSVLAFLASPQAQLITRLDLELGAWTEPEVRDVLRAIPPSVQYLTVRGAPHLIDRDNEPEPLPLQHLAALRVLELRSGSAADVVSARWLRTLLTELTPSADLYLHTSIRPLVHGENTVIEHAATISTIRLPVPNNVKKAHGVMQRQLALLMQTFPALTAWSFTVDFTVAVSTAALDSSWSTPILRQLQAGAVSPLKECLIGVTSYQSEKQLLPAICALFARTFSGLTVFRAANQHQPFTEWAPIWPDWVRLAELKLNEGFADGIECLSALPNLTSVAGIVWKPDWDVESAVQGLARVRKLEIQYNGANGDHTFPSKSFVAVLDSLPLLTSVRYTGSTINADLHEIRGLLAKKLALEARAASIRNSSEGVGVRRFRGSAAKRDSAPVLADAFAADSNTLSKQRGLPIELLSSSSSAFSASSVAPLATAVANGAPPMKLLEPTFGPTPTQTPAVDDAKEDADDDDDDGDLALMLQGLVSSFAAPTAAASSSQRSPASRCHPSHFSTALSFLDLRDFARAMRVCNAWLSASGLATAWPRLDESTPLALLMQPPRTRFIDVLSDGAEDKSPAHFRAFAAHRSWQWMSAPILNVAPSELESVLPAIRSMRNISSSNLCSDNLLPILAPRLLQWILPRMAAVPDQLPLLSRLRVLKCNSIAPSQLLRFQLLEHLELGSERGLFQQGNAPTNDAACMDAVRLLSVQACLRSLAVGSGFLGSALENLWEDRADGLAVAALTTFSSSVRHAQAVLGHWPALTRLEVDRKAVRFDEFESGDSAQNATFHRGLSQLTDAFVCTSGVHSYLPLQHASRLQRLELHVARFGDFANWIVGAMPECQSLRLQTMRADAFDVQSYTLGAWMSSLPRLTHCDMAMWSSFTVSHERAFADPLLSAVAALPHFVCLVQRTPHDEPAYVRSHALSAIATSRSWRSIRFIDEEAARWKSVRGNFVPGQAVAAMPRPLDPHGTLARLRVFDDCFEFRLAKGTTEWQECVALAQFDREDS